jgi:hypothetical protein
VLQDVQDFGNNKMGGGCFAGPDLYTDSIALGHYFNQGWKMVNSHPGYLTPSPFFDGFTLDRGDGTFRYWSLSDAIVDFQGYWGPAGNTLVPNHAFYTHGLSDSEEVSLGSYVTTPDRFFGVGGISNFALDGVAAAYEVNCVRLDDDNTSEIANHRIGDPASAYSGLVNMRHFAAANGGRYRLEFPDNPAPTTGLVIPFGNFFRGDDTLLLCLPWDGSVPVEGFLQAGGTGNADEATLIARGYRRLIDTAGENIAAVLADATGATYFQDTANDLVWVKVVGGLEARDGTMGYGDTSWEPYGGSGVGDYTDFASLARGHALVLRAQD